MSINRNGRFVPPDIKQNVGGFAADAGQAFNQLAIVRNFTAAAVNQNLGKGDNVFGLVVV